MGLTAAAACALMTSLSQPRGEMERGRSIDIRSYFSKKSDDEGKPVLI